MQESLAAYEQACSAAPNNADVWVDLGGVLEASDRWEDALAAYQRALAIYPSDSFTWTRAGKALAAVGNKADALTAFDNGLALARANLPRNLILDAWIEKGLVLGQLGRWGEALFACDNGLMQADRSAPPTKESLVAAWRLKALALVSLERWPEAIAAFDGVLAINQHDADAWNGKAFVLTKMGRRAEAQDQAKAPLQTASSWPHTVTTKPTPVGPSGSGLLEDLKSTEVGRRRKACYDAAAVGGSAIVDQLVLVLKDFPEPQYNAREDVWQCTRKAAAYALGKIADPRAINLLAREMKNDCDWEASGPRVRPCGIWDPSLGSIKVFGTRVHHGLLEADTPFARQVIEKSSSSWGIVDD